MKIRTLPLSLLVAATLTIPSLAMAAPTNTAQADMQTQADMQAQADMQTQADMQAAQTSPANSAIETQGTSANSASANQSNPFVINETQTISRARVNSNAPVNNNASQQAMPTDLQAQQQDMQEPEDAMLQEGMVEPEEDLLQEDMQEPEEDMLQEDMVN